MNYNKLKEILLWPKSKKNPHNWPWFIVAYRAPFTLACIVTLYGAAGIIFILSLFIEKPSRAAYTFSRIVNA